MRSAQKGSMNELITFVWKQFARVSLRRWTIGRWVLGSFTFWMFPEDKKIKNKMVEKFILRPIRGGDGCFASLWNPTYCIGWHGTHPVDIVFKCHVSARSGPWGDGARASFNKLLSIHITLDLWAVRCKLTEDKTSLCPEINVLFLDLQSGLCGE